MADKIDSDDRRPVRMRAPTLPGQILKMHYMEPRGVTQSDLAKVIGRSEKYISQLINGRGAARINRDIAAKLSRIFETSPDLWLNIQAATDSYVAREEAKNWVPTHVYGPPGR